jgi:hypothetical protein
MSDLGPALQSSSIPHSNLGRWTSYREMTVLVGLGVLKLVRDTDRLGALNVGSPEIGTNRPTTPWHPATS